MLDYDVIVIGGGPAGLTAGIALGRAGHRTLLLERDLYGGALKHVELVEDHPDFPDGVSGAELAAAMAERAAAAGVELREAEATGLEVFSSTRWVGCEDGQGWSAAVVIVATGLRFEKLGIPGEERLLGRGVIDCVQCDAGLFRGRAVAVCGEGEHAVADARYLERLGVRVTTLPATLREIHGSERVEAVTFADAATGQQRTLPIDGVVIRAGSAPNTDALADVVELDSEGRVVTTPDLETTAPSVLAAGDVRAGSTLRVAAAIRDGTATAQRARELLATR